MEKTAAVEGGTAHTTTTNITKSSSMPLTATVLDVKHLDDYLLSLLLPPIESEAPLGIRQWLGPALQFWTLFKTDGQTPATRLLGLKLTSSTHRLWGYAALSILLPCFYRFIKEWLQSRTTQSEILTEIQRKALERKQYIAQKMVDVVERVWPILRLASVLACWSKLTYTPDPAMIAMGYTYQRNREKPTPRLHVDYAHRRWLYEELSRTARVLLAGWTLMAVWKPLLYDSFQPLVRLWTRRCRSKSQNAQCLLCRTEPMAIPVVTNCGHVYCYACLYKQSSRKPRMNCLLCGHVIQSSERLSN